MKTNYITAVLLLFFLSLSTVTVAQESDQFANSDSSSVSEQVTTHSEQDWGIAIGMRYAEIPYATGNGDRTVTDIIPLLFFDNDLFYIRGLEGGLKIINEEQWKFNAMLRYRFFDIPADYQNSVRADTWDGGIQLRYKMDDWDLRTELLSDGRGNVYTDIGIESIIGDKYAMLYPYIGARIKSSGFNSHYYGLDQEKVSSGIDLRAYVEGRYHLISNLYAIGRLGGTYLDAHAKNSSFVQDSATWEAYAGIAFFNNPDKPRKASLRNNAYFRLAHGEATPSNLGQIIRGNREDDPYKNKLTSLFYGHPLTDDLLGLPLDIYFFAGLVNHHSSEVQDSFYEYVLGIKADYTFTWPVRWRFGAAEGLSYTSQITYIERTELEAKGYRPSKLLNYLDFTLDINLGDIFSSSSLKNTWFGYSIHHRSGIFETGSQFGRIKGGSNYTTFYLQHHF